jgi:bacillithiol biosynthesis cysteine-adding enzyme BshC
VPDPTLSTETFRSAVDIRRFPWVRRLATDYAYAFDRLAPFFAGNPYDPGAWGAAVERALARPRPRQEVVALVAAQQRSRGAPSQAFSAAERLLDPRGVAIVTGQQAGLLGGPLFTLLKALTALKLAERVSREHGVPAAAVFWVDAEDHDWAEVSSSSVLDAELARRTVTAAAPPGAGVTPVAALRLTDSIGETLDQLASVLPGTEFTPEVLDRLRATYRPGAGVVEAFAGWLESAVGHLGLVVYDSSDPGAKSLAQPVFLREIENPGHTARLAAAAGRDLVAAGYHTQVTLQDDSLALFHLDGTRRPIRRDGELFAVGEETRRHTDLLEEARQHPARFSPNVLLRPIVQDALFPTVSYVAGPNELAYLGQLKQVYEHFDLPMPLMTPRVSATLLDAGAARFLARYDVPFESLEHDDEAALNELLQRQLPASVEQSFRDVSLAVGEGMQALIASVPAVDPTLEGAARSALGRMEHELQALHGKIIQAAKRRDETLRRQFRRTRAQAFPDGEPQERVIGWVSFLNRYGPALVERLREELPLDPGRHWAIAI